MIFLYKIVLLYIKHKYLNMTEQVKTLILFPTQLFESKHLEPIFEENKSKINRIIVWEHEYYFTKYPYHKLKLAFHRATIEGWIEENEKKFKISHIKIDDKNPDTEISKLLTLSKTTSLCFFDPIELELKNKILHSNLISNKKINDTVEYVIYDSPYFLNTSEENINYLEEKSVRHDVFYKNQRIKFDIMVTGKDKPEGGKWSFDTENRLPYPKNQKDVPLLEFHSANRNSIIKSAVNFSNKEFSDNYGECTEDNFIYPINRKESIKWLEDFVKRKLLYFGKYEDAISSEIPFGYHSLLSCLTNIGLITPEDIVEHVEKYKKNIASKEGFLRQVIGWREYCYVIYDNFSKELEKNFFYDKNKKKIPKKFWEMKTEFPIIDDALQVVNNYAYSHHIDRLMVIGNFLLLIGVHPKYIFEWFQTMYIDAYYVFMYPNVYGMLLYGFIDKPKNLHMMTRPYFCSSNYLKKMSNYRAHIVTIDEKEYKWEDLFDGLYYNLINKYKNKFEKIYSTASSAKRWKEYGKKEQQEYLSNAKVYLNWIYKN